MADFLLGTGGALNDTGTGARSLATGSTITTGSTYFAGWRGTQIVTQPLLLPAYQKWHQSNVQSVVPGVGGSNYWYAPDPQGYYFHVWNAGDYCNNFGGCTLSCFPGPVPVKTVPEGTYYYRIYWRSWAAGTHLAFSWVANQDASCQGDAGDASSIFGGLRGAGGLNPSAPPDQSNANIWAREWIDGGRWASEVKPKLDSVVRPAATSSDLQALGITGDPPFDQPPQVRRIAIDAGHAPTPEGCRGATGVTQWDDVEGGYLREEVLVQEIALQIALDFFARGYVVRLTRPPECLVWWNREKRKYEESGPSLASRVDRGLADSPEDPAAEIFVSVHLNGSTNSTNKGTEAWYEARSLNPQLPEYVSQSLTLAGRIVDEQVRLGLLRRGVKANYHQVYDEKKKK